MLLVDVLPKNSDGDIVISPGGMIVGEPVDGTVNVDWFKANYPQFANAEVPLSDEQYQALQNIDAFWKQNAERWRAEGII